MSARELFSADRRWLLVPVLLVAGLALGPGLIRHGRAAPAPVEPQAVPPELRMIAGAVALRLRGLEIQAGLDHRVVFEPGAQASLPVPHFRYEGFDLVGLRLSDFERLPDDLARVEGELHFEDGLGRRAFVAFDARYRRVGANVHVTDAHVAHLLPSDPRARLFVVRTAAFEREGSEALASNLAALEWAQDHALALGGASAPSEADDYTVLAFFQDRMMPDDETWLEVGRRAGGPFERPPDTLVVDHAGWRVVAIRGQFVLGGGEPLHFRAAYRPHVANGSHDPIVAGALTTRPRSG